MEPFQDFLKICAVKNGQIINLAKIGQDIGVDEKTVKTYNFILS